MLSKFVLVCAVIGFCVALDLPPEFLKCKRTDPNLNDCMQKAIQTALPLLASGVPTLGLDKCQPLHVSGFTVGEGAGVVHVKQVYKNADIYNIVHAKISDTKANIDDTTAKLSFLGTVPEVRLEADYDLNGRILVLPVVGTGKCTLKLIDVKVYIDLNAETYEKKGEAYLKIKDLKVRLEPEKVEYNFGNLFNGDKRLGDEVNQVLNDNNLEVFNDVKSGYEDTFAAIFKNVANSVFNKIPYSVAFAA